MNLKRSVLTLGVALSLLAAGCGNDSDSADAVTEPGVETSAAPEANESDDNKAEDNKAENAADSDDTSDDPPKTDGVGDDSKPVASVDLETTTPLNNPVTLRIDVLKLRRSGKSVQLSFQINNLSDDGYLLFDKLGEEKDDNNSVAGVSLVDLANEKRYLTLVDSEGNCVCTQGHTALPSVSAQASLTLQASFPAPPKDVTMVDVDLGGLGVIGDVPLESA